MLILNESLTFSWCWLNNKSNFNIIVYFYCQPGELVSYKLINNPHYHSIYIIIHVTNHILHSGILMLCFKAACAHILREKKSSGLVFSHVVVLCFHPLRFNSPSNNIISASKVVCEMSNQRKG